MNCLKIRALSCFLIIASTAHAQHTIPEEAKSVIHEITIDASLTGERISSQLFGHNLELANDEFLPPFIMELDTLR